MPIRLSGINSGLDTESMIRELMSAQSMKKTKIQNKLTKLEWKEEKWKSLNTKIYNLYREELSKLKSQSSYLTKKVTTTDASKATVKASSNVPTGTHSLDITKVACSQFVTGKKLDGDIKIYASDRVVDKIDGVVAGTVLSVKKTSDSEASTYKITERTTLSDLTSWFKSNGISFNYDNQNGRFFLSSIQTGTENAFTLTSSTDIDEENGYNDVLLYQVGYDWISHDNATGSMFDTLKTALDNYSSADADKKELGMAQLSVFGKANDEASKALYEKYIQDKYEEIVGKDNKDFELKWSDDHKTWSIEKVNKDAKESVSTYRKKLEAFDTAYNKEEVIKSDIEYSKTYNDKYAEIYDKYDELYNEYAEAIEANDLTTVNHNMSNVFDAMANGYSALKEMGIGEITDPMSDSTSSGAKVLVASKLICKYNGIEYTSDSNTFSVNGLTIEAIDKTTSTLKINVTNDTQAVYDSIKNFVKKYNEILKEMNESFYAKPAKGYDVLTDEEKDQMTDDQIEKWENKIKDSLLRKDSNLETVLSTLKSITSISVKYEGKEYSLASFNIASTDYTEKGLLHIYGDQEDPDGAGRTDKLMAALTEDPDKVMTIFTEIGTQLYNKLQDNMGSTKLSSALTFYNDKEMADTKKDYQDQLKKWDERLKDMEDRYYKKFAAMETAMQKMNSQTSYITSLFGGNQ